MMGVGGRSEAAAVAESEGDPAEVGESASAPVLTTLPVPPRPMCVAPWLSRRTTL